MTTMTEQPMPQATSPPALRALAEALRRRIHASLAEAATPAQANAYEEALRHVKGLQRALDKAELGTIR